MSWDTSPQTSTSTLLEFLAARFDEDHWQAGPFHELTCPVPSGPDGTDLSDIGPRRCRCPCPARLIARVETQRRIMRDCEHRIAHQDQQDSHWPLDVIFAMHALFALALPYELHSEWHEQWRPGGSQLDGTRDHGMAY